MNQQVDDLMRRQFPARTSAATPGHDRRKSEFASRNQRDIRAVNRALIRPSSRAGSDDVGFPGTEMEDRVPAILILLTVDRWRQPLRPSRT